MWKVNRMIRRRNRSRSSLGLKEAQMRGAILSIGIWTGALFLTASFGSNALGQSTEAQAQSRAARLQAEREAKAQKLEKPKKSSAEKGLYWWDNQNVVTRVLSGWRGFHIATGSFANGAGLTFGAGFTDLAVGSVYPEADAPNQVDVNDS